MIPRAFILLAYLLFQNVFANLPKDPVEYAVWESKMLDAVRNQSKNHPAVAIPNLGFWVMQMGMPNNLEMGDRPVFKAAQTALLALPGHAEYFVNEIKQAKAAAISPEELQGRDGKISWSNYNRVRSEAFDTLEHLPSIETVRALGEFLGDEENPNALRPGDGTPDTLGPGSNSGLAIMALRTLIQNDPIKFRTLDLELGETQVWQQWYEQIKAGNRTFRFEGDLTEYDLDGPAPKEKLTRIERDRKRDEERAAGQKKTSSAPESAVSHAPINRPLSIAGLFAACVLCVAAVWYLLRGRKVARKS